MYVRIYLNDTKSLSLRVRATSSHSRKHFVRLRRAKGCRKRAFTKREIFNTTILVLPPFVNNSAYWLQGFRFGGQTTFAQATWKYFFFVSPQLYEMDIQKKILNKRRDLNAIATDRGRGAKLVENVLRSRFSYLFSDTVSFSAFVVPLYHALISGQFLCHVNAQCNLARTNFHDTFNQLHPFYEVAFFISNVFAYLFF